MKAPIHSEKHYVQITRSSVLTVARNNENLITAVQIKDKDAVDEVIEGAIVKAVYIELWVLNQGNDGSDVVILSKQPLNFAGPSFANMNALGIYNNKKNILFVHQGLSANDSVANPINIMRAWYKIPKSKQRFGLGDSLVLTIANNALNSLDYCGFAIYKEYT